MTNITPVVNKSGIPNIIEMDEQVTVAERSLLGVADEVWELAVRRAEVIGRRAAMDALGSLAPCRSAGLADVYPTVLARWR